MSNIFFNCPCCAASLEVDATATGMCVACPTCGKEIVIPSCAPLPIPSAHNKAPASDFKKVLEDASAETVALIEEASKQTKKMIGH